MPTIDRNDMYTLLIFDGIDPDTYKAYDQLTICEPCCEKFGLTSDALPDESNTAMYCPVCGRVLTKKDKM